MYSCLTLRSLSSRKKAATIDLCGLDRSIPINELQFFYSTTPESLRILGVFSIQSLRVLSTSSLVNRESIG